MAKEKITKENENGAKETRRMKEILKILKREYPEAECSLTHENPFQLLVSTILSAQCTDARVNIVTPALFEKYSNSVDFANAKLSDIEQMIRTTGFFRSKAKSIQEASRSLVGLHGGKVPQTLEQLTALRGVGRKTANVVLGVAFNKPSLVVDTHVKRLSFRLGFTKLTDPEKIEAQMMGIVPQEDWTEYAHLMISHGRKICTARKALCEECPILNYCPRIGVK